MILVMLVASTGAGLAYLLGAWPRLENSTLDARFALRGPSPPSSVVVVAVDDKTFSDLDRQWPFPRGMHAQVISRLAAAGARTIAYDVQFTEPTTQREDLALYEAIDRSRVPVVLATTEVDAAGETNVLGGKRTLNRIRAVAAAANLPSDPGGVIRRYPYSLLGLRSFAVATVEAGRRPVAAPEFDHGGALIDFGGPPGTIRTVSFSDVLHGLISPGVFRDKVVIVGATSATLQDLHQTSVTSGGPMAGPEIQANAISTALQGNPLQEAPRWLTLITILLAGAVLPLASLRLRVLRSLFMGSFLTGAYLVAAQVAFEAGVVLTVTYPLAALALGVTGMIGANYLAAFLERNTFARQLRASQVELIQRLAHAIDTRDTETGGHVERIARLSQRLALQLGWSAEHAEMLRHASAMHDIGKIGIPDSVLLKRGKPTPQEWETIKAHTTVGAEILAGSANPLVEMAREIAIAHHEHWDGSGYPAGLRGEEIPVAARICAIVDVYDALLSKRTYKEAWSPEQTLAEIQHGSGTHFDPELVAAFMELVAHLAREDLTPVRPSAGFSQPLPAPRLH